MKPNLLTIAVVTLLIIEIGFGIMGRSRVRSLEALTAQQQSEITALTIDLRDLRARSIK